MDNINILITGAGAPGIAGTVYSLKKEKIFNLKLIGTDIRENVVGKYFLDRVYRVPPPSNDFINTILEICEKEKIDVILPQVTAELEWFANNKKKFEKKGIKVLVSDYESLIKSNNKYKLLECCAHNKINCTGKFFLVDSIDDIKEKAKEIGYPQKSFVIKRTVSSGMKGLRIVKSDFDKYKNFMNEKPDTSFVSFDELISIFENKKFPELLMTEYFPGDEYSVDLLVENGKTVVCLPRKRNVIRMGITFESEAINNLEIIEYCKKIVKVLKLDYIVGFQFKLDENGKPRLLESNPRVQGTMVLSTFAGANIILGAIKQALYGDSNLDQKDIIWGTKLIRYWGAIGDVGGRFTQI